MSIQKRTKSSMKYSTLKGNPKSAEVNSSSMYSLSNLRTVCHNSACPSSLIFLSIEQACKPLYSHLNTLAIKVDASRLEDTRLDPMLGEMPLTDLMRSLQSNAFADLAETFKDLSYLQARFAVAGIWSRRQHCYRHTEGERACPIWNNVKNSFLGLDSVSRLG